MYEIKYNDNYIYMPGDKDYVAIDPTLELKANKAGSLVFSVLDTHPLYNELEKLKLAVNVLKDGDTIFKGRIVGSERNFDNELEMTVEGKLTVLNDSPCRPYEFTGTPEELFAWFLDNHNSQVSEGQKLLKGNVTVTDPNNYISRSWDKTDNTWNLINSRLLDTLGGYLVVRYEEDGDYLDWIKEFTDYSEQSIEFGMNLTDFEQLIDAEETYTACIPYGSEIINDGARTGQLLTIESVNGGKDYLINESRASLFGTIYAPTDLTTWEDVTVPGNLLKKATEWLNNTGIMLKETIELSAVDLATAGVDINAFEMYKNVSVKSEPHGIDTTRLTTSLTIALDLSEVTKVVLGSSRLTLSAQVVGAKDGQDGSDGKSAYQIAKENGFTGTEEEWLESLVGEDGRSISSITNYYLATSLPVDYTQLEYIESTGTQHIDTGYSAPDGFIADVEFAYTEHGNSYVLGSFGLTAPYGANGFGCVGSMPEWELGAGNGTVYDSSQPDISLNTKYTIRCSTLKGNSYLEVDGTRVLASTDSSARYAGNLLLFHTQVGIQNGMKSACGKLYSLKIYDPNGVLIRNYVPCKNANGVVGLYDLVNDQFYENAGSGTFVAGTATSEWTTAIQTVTADKKYLWNYEVIAYTEGEPTTTTPCIIGTYGDKGATGNGIASITEYYQVSSSNTTAPTSWETAPPPMTATNKYLWNYEVIKYTDDNEHVSKKRVIGVYGDKGKSAYEVAKENGFAGTEDEWLESLVGKDGEDGDPGSPGDDGKTSYLHIAYGTDINGANFKTTYFDGATHIGTCTDFTEADPTTASSYTWAKIKGEDGKDGVDGSVVLDGTEKALIVGEDIRVGQAIKVFYLVGEGYSYSVYKEDPFKLEKYEKAPVIHPDSEKYDYELITIEDYDRYTFTGAYSDVSLFISNDVTAVSKDVSILMNPPLLDGSETVLTVGEDIQIGQTINFIYSKSEGYRYAVYKADPFSMNTQTQAPVVDPANKFGYDSIVIEDYDTYTFTGMYSDTSNKLSEIFATKEELAEAGNTLDSYTLLEYIESTGTQYIDSLYSAPNGFIFDCEFSWTNIGGSYIVGSYNTQSPYGRNGVGLAGGQNYWELGTGDRAVQAPSHTVTLGIKYKVQGSTLKGNSYLDIDGERIITSSDSAGRHPESLLLFYIHYGKYFGDPTALGKLYSMKIYDPNGVLIRNYVPCKNANGVVGLYDLVNGQFYENAGTGTFIAGPVFNSIRELMNMRTKIADLESEINKLKMS